MRHDYSQHANHNTILQSESSFRKEWAKGLKIDVTSFALTSVENADRDATECKGLTFPHNGQKHQHMFSVEKRTFINVRVKKPKPVRMIQPAVKVLTDPSDYDGRTLDQHRSVHITRLKEFYDAKNNPEIAAFEKQNRIDHSEYVEPEYRDNFRTESGQSDGYTMLLEWIQAQNGRFDDVDSDDDY